MVPQEQPGLPLKVQPHEAPPQQGDAPPEAKPENAITLGQLVAEGFTLFTPALVVTHGLLDRDPVLEFNRTHQTEDPAERPFQIDCDYPLFQDLGASLLNGSLIQWDRRLYGIVDENWPQIRDFIAAMGCYDIPRQHYAKVGFHELRIVDPTALHSGRIYDELPTVDITVFCVSTNRNFVWMQWAADPPRSRAFARVDPPRADIQQEASAVLGPPPSPERVADFVRPKP
jgi:hypothetical protein